MLITLIWLIECEFKKIFIREIRLVRGISIKKKRFRVNCYIVSIILVDKDGNQVDPKTLDGRDDYTLVNCLPYTMPEPQMEYLFNDMPKIKNRGQSNHKYKSVGKNKRKMVKASKRKNRKR